MAWMMFSALLVSAAFTASPALAGNALDQSLPPYVGADRGLVAGELLTARFRIVFTNNSRLAAKALGTQIERERDRLVGVLGRDWTGVTEVRIGRGREEFERLALPGGEPPPWAAALAYPERNVILLESIGLSEPTGSVTLRHELSHVALGQLGRQWPHWFQEGMAMYLTNESPLVARHAILYRALSQDRLFHFEHLAAQWPIHPLDVEIAYAQSLAFVTFLLEEHDAAGFGEMFDHVGKGEPFELAFAKAFHSSLNVEEQRWREFAARRYSWLPLVTGGSALWGLSALICVAAYLRRRRNKATRLAEMEIEDTFELALAANDSPSEDSPPSAPQSGTLH